ncbi:HYC_CC_PP family protein [Aequorivita capsosiphonis]|uniref:HYC_CC_PP family protein n=1 Tax=Aequorivita capsosiphonis TaxID=487317 RepID=UPI00047BAAA7|nr:hypothetical protein [Aequorivita capsosiphonis]
MNSFFHKIVSVCLATLVLFTTMSFTVDMHYCGESLVDFSLSQNAHTCGMETEQPSDDCEIGIPDDSCCSDKQIVVEGQDDLKISFDTLNFEQQTFVATFFYTYINLFEDLDTNIIPFRDYKPPLLIRDIQKLHETYLI